MGTDAVHLLHLTDPHLYEDESCRLYGVATDGTFLESLATGLAVAPRPLTAIVVTGDVAEDGLPGTYARFRSRMERIGLPVLCLPGNHDDAAFHDELDRGPLQACGSASYGAWRVVLLDSRRAGHDSGWLDDGELARLDRELGADPAQHALVCLHHPPLPVGSPWLDALGLINSEALFAVLSRHRNVRALLCGHVHQACDRVVGGIRMLCTPSTCAQFTPHTSTCLMDVRPPGLRWLSLRDDGTIATDVVWLEHLRMQQRAPDSRRLPAVST